MIDVFLNRGFELRSQAPDMSAQPFSCPAPGFQTLGRSEESPFLFQDSWYEKSSVLSWFGVRSKQPEARLPITVTQPMSSTTSDRVTRGSLVTRLTVPSSPTNSTVNTRMIAQPFTAEALWSSAPQRSTEVASGRRTCQGDS